MDRSLKITLKPWDYTCADGCCSEYGTTVCVDGKQVTEHGDQDHILLRSVLEHLGYTVTITGLDSNDEEIWTG